ncbi:solute:sodium symporter family transporter [Anaerococcus porci]|uniref:solute:sodium symporter family transporter n=1 Tax=Anaerococcus porci TaxID=2652269 RepID=UPI002A754E36|nr:solute:sodium symporter family transporter [Anaerococcus porci]MDY3007389.1 solute:sodium symporter family transporter [Anaerococcus porci]
MFFIIASFAIIVCLIGFIAYKKTMGQVDTTSSEGYFLGGKSLTAPVVAGTIIMTNLSTEQIVGQNGQSYVAGMQVMAWEVTAAVAIALLAAVFLPKYFRYGINTISDFIEIRYDTMTKRIVSILFIITYMVSFMPVVLYSGALVFNKLFRVDQMLGISPIAAITIMVIFIGVVGVLYLFLGGMTLSAYSDTIYQFGLIIGGLAIPFLGLRLLGDGSFLAGIEHVTQNTPELLNSIGSVDSKIVPWPTLFTGMFFNNLFFWCTNQMIVQKAFAAKNLKEAQKGALLVGTFKIFGALFLVFPGVVARNLFGDKFLSLQDGAYPQLVVDVLPTWAMGLFGAVIFGAILSSFAGSLSSTSTLFALDFYKPIINKNATDSQMARVGRLTNITLGVISIIVAPFISKAGSGLYAFVQEFNGLYNMPLLIMIVGAFYFKQATATGAKTTMIFHVVVYALSKIFLKDIHYLYVLSGLFFVDLLIYIIVSKLTFKGNTFEISHYSIAEEVEVEPWSKVKVLSIVIIIVVIATYLFFSPLGIARV